MKIFYKIFSYPVRQKKGHLQRVLFALTLLVFACCTSVSAQNFTLGTVEQGPYGHGSSITVPIVLAPNACFSADNRFRLYLSDATGSFTGAKMIGEVQSHFATFINGKIPALNLPAGNYKLRVSSTSPKVDIDYPTDIAIQAISASVLDIQTEPENVLTPDLIYGFCFKNQGGNTLSLKNFSAKGTTLTGTLTNDFDKSAPVPIQFVNGFADIPLTTAYYTASFKLVDPGTNIISTKSFVILNSTFNLIYGAGVERNICYPDKLEYVIAVHGTGGIESNYPGMVYAFDWGDNSGVDYKTHCEVMALDGKMEHLYNGTSCGLTHPVNGSYVFNAFATTVSFVNDFCTNVPRVTYAHVYLRPDPKFDGPSNACVGNSVTFKNLSVDGSQASGASCEAASNFKWYVNGVKVAETKDLTYAFPAAGEYEVKLEAKNLSCTAAEKKMKVCVYEKPQPAFTFTKSSACTLPLDVKLANQTPSTGVALCGVESYKWEIIDNDLPVPAAISPNFISGNSTSREPEIRFTTPGNYTIRLTVSNPISSDNSCASTTLEKTLIIPGGLNVTMPSTKAYCRDLPLSLDFATDANHKPSYLGAGENPIYSWQVTGGTFDFIDNTTAASKYPHIRFNEVGSYTVTVTYSSDCNSSKSASQVIKIYGPFTVNAGTDASICYSPLVPADNKFTFSGTALGADQTGKWTLVSGPNASATFSNSTIPNATVNGLVPGDYVFRWSISNTAGCAEYDDITIKVITPPTKPIVANPIVYCEGDLTGALTAQVINGNTLVWFTSPSLTGGSEVAPVPLSTPSGTQIFYVVQKDKNSGCYSDTSQVIVKIIPSISNNIISSPSSADPVCYNSIPAKFIAASPLSGGTNTYAFKWEQSDDNGLTWKVASGNSTVALYTPQAALTKTTIYRRVVYSGKCSSISNEVTITVLAPLANEIDIITKNVCEGDAPPLLHGDPITGSKGPYMIQWQSSTGSVWTDIPGANQESYQPGPLTIQTNFRRMVTTGCSGPSPSQLVVVVVNRKAWSDFKADKKAGCAPFSLATANIAISPHPDRNDTFQWFVDGVALAPPSLGYNFPGYTINEEGKTVVVKLVTTSKNGCASDEQEMNFSTYAKITSADFEIDKTSGCGPVEVNFNNTSLPLTGVNFKWDFGNGQTSTDIQPGKVVFQADPLGLNKVYTVKLTVSTDCDVKTFFRDILVKSVPQAIYTPSKVEGCSPMTVTFTNQSRGEGATYRYEFSDGTIKDMGSDMSDLSHTFITDKTITVEVKLVVTNECGTNSYVKNIVVHPNSIVPNLVVNGNSLRGCAPFTVDFDNNSTGANNFYWDFGDGGLETSSVYPETKTHTFTKPGTYTITLRATNGCSDLSTSTTIQVFDAPIPSFTVPKLLYCAGEPIAFSNNAIPGIVYRWDFGDGSIRNQVNPTYAYNSSGKFTVKLTAIQLINGVSCSQTSEQEIEIAAKANPIINANDSPLNCAPFTFNVSASGGNTTNIEWDFGDPMSGVDNTVIGLNANHKYIQPGTYIVKARVFNQLGCFEIFQRQITVIASPIADFDGLPLKVCGRNAVFNLVNKTIYSGSDPIVYEWYINGTKVSTLKNLTNFSFSVPAGISLPHKVNVQLIAKSSVRGCSSEKSFEIFFNPVAKPGFTLAESSHCAPFTLQITNTSTDADSYNWYLDGKLISTQKVPNIVLDKSATEYSLKLEVNNIYGCADVLMPVRVSTYPTPEALFDLKTPVSCDGFLKIDGSNVTNSSKGTGTDPLHYLWEYGDGTTSEGEHPDKLYTLPGKYDITLTVSNGNCSDFIKKSVTIYPSVKADFNVNTTKGCRRVTINFENLSKDAKKYIWDFGDGTFDFNKNPAPHTFTFHKSPYTVKMIAENEAGCRDTSAEVVITVAAPPETFFSALPGDSIKIPDYTFQFDNSTEADDKTTYLWDFGDQTTSTDKNPPRHTYRNIGKYTVKLTATNKDGCDSTFQRIVEVQNIQSYLYVPNAFEPGSNVNEIKEFKPIGKGLAEYSLRIFNRWGALVFETHTLDREGAPKESWDGTFNNEPAMQGVYVWDISGRFLDGTEWKGMKYRTGNLSKSGSFNLIR